MRTLPGALATLLLTARVAIAVEPFTFIQMSDPQFGMFTENQSYEHETANFEFAIAAANRLKPRFVVVTGDLVNEAGDAAQVAEYLRVAAKLDPAIKLYNVPGNHDVGNQPTPASLAAYRKVFHHDYYQFRIDDFAGIVLNSSVIAAPDGVPEDAARQEQWLRTMLDKERREDVRRIVIFQHHPWFLSDAGEPDQYFNIPKATRARYLELLHQYGVTHVFAGHYHRNAFGRDGTLQMFTTGPVGKPIGEARSGIRVVKVSDAAIEERYYDFGELP